MQVVMTTHSPLVLNELEGHEISIVTRDERGTRVVRMCDTDNFEERRKLYKPGELWLAYTDAENESKLVGGRP